MHRRRKTIFKQFRRFVSNLSLRDGEKSFLKTFDVEGKRWNQRRQMRRQTIRDKRISHLSKYSQALMTVRQFIHHNYLKYSVKHKTLRRKPHKENYMRQLYKMGHAYYQTLLYQRMPDCWLLIYMWNFFYFYFILNYLSIFKVKIFKS